MMPDEEIYIHFTFSPVQPFLAQARRTRDLWIASYLLSYLAVVAMKEIENHGGKIILPEVSTNPLMQAIRNGLSLKPEDPAARVGSLPNRFMFVVNSNSNKPEEVAQKAKDALLKAWEKIGNEGWKLFSATLDGHCTSEDFKSAEEIWKRQVENQWEIIWVQGREGRFLDIRKNLRAHFPPDEPGEKCTQCGEREALRGNDTSRKGIVNFWTQVSQEFSGRHFRPDGKERLCAICTIKRTLPLFAKEALGWELLSNFPSTSYMSAVPWIKEVLTQADQNDTVARSLGEFTNLINTSLKNKIPFDEMQTQIPGIMKVVKENKDWKKFAGLTGGVFFQEDIDSKDDFPDLSPPERTELKEKLKNLQDSAKCQAHPFYALLVIDGDSMGKLISRNPGKEGEISSAMEKFAQNILKIVEANHDGKLIYGGGDDLMALLPLDDALKCAKELRQAFIKVFETMAPDVKVNGHPPTISAGLVYAHKNTPLRNVIADAHYLLNEVAKKQPGKDALAIRLWKHGGPIVMFSRKWVTEIEQKKVDIVDTLNELKKGFAKETDKTYTSGFFYRIEELKEVLKGFSPDQIANVLVAEYLKSRALPGLKEDQSSRRKEAEERINALLPIILSAKGEVSPDGLLLIQVSPDGLLLIRFLAQKEV